MADACKSDDVSSILSLFDASTDPTSALSTQELLRTCLEDAVKANAAKILLYVLEQGADATTNGADLTLTWGDASLPSLATLGILVAHGWDINSFGHTANSGPLLWMALRDPTLVEWCLAHGASVTLPDSRCHERRPILGRAAAIGDVATFELLRTHGAPLSSRVLPGAVRSANDSAPKTGESPSAIHERHLGMVRHLINTIGIDPNTASYWAGSTCSTLLCCIACYPTGAAAQLIWLLLDKGGDLHLAGPSSGVLEVPSALEAAVQRKNTSFIQAVKIWQQKKREEA